MNRIYLFTACALLAAGCKSPEYTNSIQGEIKTQKLIADYAFAQKVEQKMEQPETPCLFAGIP